MQSAVCSLRAHVADSLSIHSPLCAGIILLYCMYLYVDVDLLGAHSAVDHLCLDTVLIRTLIACRCSCNESSFSCVWP